MTLVRTDIHRPSVIEPADYDFVGFEHLKTDNDPFAAPVVLEHRARIREHMTRTGGTYSRHAHGGSCHICGAHAVYTALFHHPKSNSYVRTGLDCAEKLECRGAEAFRKSVEHAREAAAGKRKAKALLEDAKLGAAWAIYSNPDKPFETPYEERVIIDMVARLIKYGSISDKAMNYMAVLIDKIGKRASIEAARNAEKLAAKPIPIEYNGKRVTIRGEVLTVKAVETHFGPTVKMLVKHTDGWKLWGTRPRELEDLARGDVVEFDGKVEVSRDDPKFGFYVRPTKARFVSRVPDNATWKTAA